MVAGRFNPLCFGGFPDSTMQLASDLRTILRFLEGASLAAPVLEEQCDHPNY
jgi:hypothetical protein